MIDSKLNAPMNIATSKLSYDDFREIILKDYEAAVQSRYVSLLGRKEVLTGKAKFGIFGDGKEVAQIALAKVFEEGDWRSGYYRDQTLAFATGISSIYHFFSQLYANPSLEADTSSGTFFYCFDRFRRTLEESIATKKQFFGYFYHRWPDGTHTWVGTGF